MYRVCIKCGRTIIIQPPQKKTIIIQQLKTLSVKITRTHITPLISINK